MNKTEVVRMTKDEFRFLVEALDFPTATTCIYVETGEINSTRTQHTLVDYGMPNEREIARAFWGNLTPRLTNGRITKVIIRA